MQEIRGVWIANRPHSQVLSSPENITQAMDFLESTGFNAVFPVVWNRGFTLYPSEVMRRHFGEDFTIYPDYQNRNPLQELITAAHHRGIAVIPWFEYGFACSERADGGHIIAHEPQFAGRDRQGLLLNQGGLTWMNAFHSEVQQLMLELVLEVVKNYNVDGIQGDDRFPAYPVTGFDARIAADFTQQFYRQPRKDRDREWQKFRADILTNFLARLYFQVKSLKPNLLFSIAPSVYPFCYEHFLQDYPTWVKHGLVDLICPQVYRETYHGTGMYLEEINKIRRCFSAKERKKFAPGIALKAHNQEVQFGDLWQYIQLNRISGFQGQIFFHYEGLRNHSDAIALALRQTVYSEFAFLPLPLTKI